MVVTVLNVLNLIVLQVSPQIQISWESSDASHSMLPIVLIISSSGLIRGLVHAGLSVYWQPDVPHCDS